MSGLVVDGARIAVPGVNVVSWLDDPARAPKVTDGATRKQRPLAIVLHTSRGVPGKVREGARPSTVAETLARYQSRTERQVSWHLTIDTDGDVLQQADASTWTAWHAGHANRWTVGIELAQHQDSGDLWRAQLVATVAVVTALCDALAIPKRYPVRPDGAPMLERVLRWASAGEGGAATPWQGVLPHCALTRDRGPGDCGPHVFEALRAAGFTGVMP